MLDKLTTLCYGIAKLSYDLTNELGGAKDMERKSYDHEELQAIAAEIMESLRPMHLTVREIQLIAEYLHDASLRIVLREKAE